jgi:hypothetical protein
MDTLLPEDLKRELGKYTHKEKLTIVLQELTKKMRYIKIDLAIHSNSSSYERIYPSVYQEEFMWCISGNGIMYIWLTFTCHWIIGHSIHQLKSVLRQVDQSLCDENIHIYG